MHRPKSFQPPWIDFFTRPCPHYIKQSTTFSKFLLLPKELQFLIWSFVELEAKTLICTGRERQHSRYEIRRRRLNETRPLHRYKVIFPQRPLSETCYDSRQECLKSLECVFKPYMCANRTAYFNFNRDWLATDWPFFRRMLSIGTEETDTIAEMARVQFLHLKLDCQADRIHIGAVCRFFTNLKKLHITVPDRDDMLIPRTAALPYTFREDENSFFHDWAWLETRIKAAVPHVRGALNSWEAPILAVGTGKQWINHEKEEKLIREDNCRARSHEDEMEWEPVISFPSFDLVLSTDKWSLHL